MNKHTIFLDQAHTGARKKLITIFNIKEEVTGPKAQPAVSRMFRKTNHYRSYDSALFELICHDFLWLFALSIINQSLTF